MKSFNVDASQVKLRVEQLLGLPANTKNTHIVEFWVNPNDLFRPAPDREISDKTAQIVFTNFSDSLYQKWYSDNVFASYYMGKSYPWTRLGYTYDWGNSKTEIGLSEFVIWRGSTIHIVSVTKLEDYLK